MKPTTSALPRPRTFALVLGAAAGSAATVACLGGGNPPPGATCHSDTVSFSVAACPDAGFPGIDASTTFDATAPEASIGPGEPVDAAPDGAPVTDGGGFALAPRPAACKGAVAPDTTFGTQGIAIDPGMQDSNNTIALQADGKYVVTSDYALARYNTDGSIDTTFGTSGYVLTTEISTVSAMLPQPNGDVVLGGYTSFSACGGLARLDKSGNVDPTFGTNGYAGCPYFASAYGSGFDVIAQRPNGYFVAAGNWWVTTSQSDLGVVQYDPNGVPDPTFGTGGHALAGFTVNTGTGAMLIQPDGKVLVAGETPVNLEAGPGRDDLTIARFNVDGSLDTTFATGGRARLINPGVGPAALAVQSTGAILVVVAGDSTLLGFIVRRLTPAGALDTTFGSGGTTQTQFAGLGDESNGVYIYADDTFVLGGYSAVMSDAGYGVDQPALARYSADGILDTTFGVNGTYVATLPAAYDQQDNFISGEVLLPNGDVVLAGGAGLLDDAGSATYQGLLVRFGCP